MTTYILGSNGKLGRVLASQARAAGLDWRTPARSGAADVIWQGDTGVDSPMFKAGATLINMIGYTGNDPEKLQEANQRFVSDLLVKAARQNVAHLVLASSAAVYGAGSGKPFNETDPLNPITRYGASKVAMEALAQAFSECHNSPAVTILRIGNVAGTDALTDAAQQHIATNTPMPLHRFEGGLAALRSYIGPYDLFRTIRDLCPVPDANLRIFNVAHPSPVPLDAMLKAYRARIFPKLTWIDAPAPFGVPPVVTLATQKLEAFVQFSDASDPSDAFVSQIA